MNSNVINKIAFGTAASVALPTLPNLGTNIGTWGTDWPILVGSVPLFSDDANLEPDTVEAAVETQVEEVFAARSLAPEDLVLLRRRINDFTFMCKDGGETLFGVDSNGTIASNVFTFGTTIAFRSAAVEVNGLWVDHYPKVAVFIDQMSAGYGQGGVGKTRFTVIPLAVSGTQAGFERTWYQSA